MKTRITSILFFLISTISFTQTFTNTSYENDFSGTSYNGGGQSWTQEGIWGSNIITYGQNNQMEITFTQTSWVYATNRFDNSIDISNNKVLELEASFTLNDKFLLVQLIDANGVVTPAALQSIFPITSTSSNLTVDYGALSISSFDFSKVVGIKFYIVSNSGATGIPIIAYQKLTLHSIKLGDSAGGGNNNIDIIRWTGDQQNINIYNANSGNVSIGTNPASEPSLSTPYYKFTVKGRTNLIGTSNALSLWHTNTQTNGYRHYMVLGHEKFSDGSDFGVLGVNEYSSTTGKAKPKHLLLQTNTQDGGANVGVGSFSIAPVAKLTVKSGTNPKAISVVNTSNEEVCRITNEGIIYATEIQIKLTDDFPDYVFAKNYNLMSLDSLESFIDLTSHLPNIPSAEEVKNEIGIGEMTRLQQEKIEELTLYILELKKRIEALEVK